MPVEVNTVRAVSVPSRLVHGPGAASALAGEVATLGCDRPLLVTVVVWLGVAALVVGTSQSQL